MNHKLAMVIVSGLGVLFSACSGKPVRVSDNPYEIVDYDESKWVQSNWPDGTREAWVESRKAAKTPKPRLKTATRAKE